MLNDSQVRSCRCHNFVSVQCLTTLDTVQGRSGSLVLSVAGDARDPLSITGYSRFTLTKKYLLMLITTTTMKTLI